MKKYREILVSIVCVMIIAAIVAVLTMGASYTVLLGDDFSHGVRVGAFHVSLPQYIGASFRYVKELYFDWQGTFFSMFLQAFLSPINNFGLSQLWAVMIGNALAFLLSLLALLWVGLSFLADGKKLFGLRMLLLTLFFVTVTNADVYTETYFWYSGAVAYSMPFSVLLVALTLFLLLNRGRGGKTGGPGAASRGHRSMRLWARRVCAVLCGILLFLSSGGSLAVAGCGCYAALVLTVVFALREGALSAAGGHLSEASPEGTRRRALRHALAGLSAENVIILAAGVTGALINAAAPGNFARHDGTAGPGLHVLQALLHTMRMFVEETGRLFRETTLGLVFLGMIAAGLYLAGKCEISLREYGVATVLMLAAGLVADFPVALGYGGSYVPNRCYFIIDTALVLSLLNLALFVGVCMHRLPGAAADARTVPILLYVCLAAVIVSPLALEEMPLYRVARSVHNGSYRTYYETCRSVYDYLETCPEEDVVLEMPDYIEDFACFYFDEDESGWVNRGIAAYYGKRSVRRAAE